MSSVASFNLLKFVERNPVLNANRIFGIFVLFIIGTLSYYVYQTLQLRDNGKKMMILTQSVQQTAQTLQPLLQQGAGNPLMGVMPYNILATNARGFNAEFEALSHIQVKGLWLIDVEINRYPAFIKITGAMDSSDKLDILLKQLAAQPAFKSVQFVGIDITKGLLPDVPSQYRKELKQLKIPSFFHFVIQTTAIKSTGIQP